MTAAPDRPGLDRRGPRPPRATATRQRLLAAGRELFAEHGAAEVTSHAIAARAGYASGTFYLHFKDKLALFRELADEAASEIERRLQWAAIQESSESAILRAQAEALIGFAEEQRDLLLILFQPGSEATAIAAGILERLAGRVRALRHKALAARRAPSDLDPDVLAQAIVGMWAHVLVWWAEDPRRASRDGLVQTLTHFQLHGDRSDTNRPCAPPRGEETR